MTDRTLKGKVSKLRELQTEIDAMTAQAESLKDAIKAEMIIRAVDELEAAGNLVKWKPIVSSRFDTKGFKAAHSGLYAQFIQQTETRRFTVVPV
ncbi:MAG: hypothetical protein FWG94_11990 [Oscillospiraceae bacterium]|nr:hypothetical protein [Oscillospiraceae bacterium]